MQDATSLVSIDNPFSVVVTLLLLGAGFAGYVFFAIYAIVWPLVLKPWQKAQEREVRAREAENSYLRLQLDLNRPSETNALIQVLRAQIAEGNREIQGLRSQIEGLQGDSSSREADAVSRITTELEVLLEDFRARIKTGDTQIDSLREQVARLHTQLGAVAVRREKAGPAVDWERLAHVAGTLDSVEAKYVKLAEEVGDTDIAHMLRGSLIVAEATAANVIRNKDLPPDLGKEVGRIKALCSRSLQVVNQQRLYPAFPG